ncbi:hypothetical protein CK503_06915 [Aliifodinibius salipaludis]|uniref:Uncharacterized protein n=1 Tax=Fodinibius salipaludis TaxID=2032627 RepID=A0A2A2GBE8_9BACT|nr:hypothetical protein [Aliifodinibius salipaludis]PAU94520.1 hypothetical protein CK503_06915 [Aliifodinibius salipaludis]
MDQHKKVRYGMVGGGPGDEPNKLALDFPTVEDGARGVHFIHKAIESGKNKKWVAMDYNPPGSNAKNP